jgi:hypothetical protein
MIINFKQLREIHEKKIFSHPHFAAPAKMPPEAVRPHLATPLTPNIGPIRLLVGHYTIEALVNYHDCNSSLSGVPICLRS